MRGKLRNCAGRKMGGNVYRRAECTPEAPINTTATPVEPPENPLYVPESPWNILRRPIKLLETSWDHLQYPWNAFEIEKIWQSSEVSWNPLKPWTHRNPERNPIKNFERNHEGIPERILGEIPKRNPRRINKGILGAIMKKSPKKNSLKISWREIS